MRRNLKKSFRRTKRTKRNKRTKRTKRTKRNKRTKRTKRTKRILKGGGTCADCGEQREGNISGCDNSCSWVGVYKIGENTVGLGDIQKYKFIDNVIDYTLGHKSKDYLKGIEITEDTTTTYTETATSDTIIVKDNNFYYNKGKVEGGEVEGGEVEGDEGGEVEGEVITMNNGTNWDTDVKKVKEEARVNKKQQKQQQLRNAQTKEQFPTFTAAHVPFTLQKSDLCHDCKVKPHAIGTEGHCMYCWLVKNFGGVYKTGDHIVGEINGSYNQNDENIYNFIDNIVRYITRKISAKFLIKSKITLNTTTNVYTINIVDAKGSTVFTSSLPINHGVMFYTNNQKIKKIVNNKGEGDGKWVEEDVVFTPENIKTAKTNYTTEEIKSSTTILGRLIGKKQPAQQPAQQLQQCTEWDNRQQKCSNNSYLNIPPYYCRKHALENPVIWEKRE